MERFVIDTVMESVFAMERSYTERLLHNLGLCLLYTSDAADE